MTDGSAALKQYLLLLNRFGLSESEVIDLHWSGPVPDDASAQGVVAHVVDEAERTPDALYDRLHRVLANSSKGIDAERSYDPDAPGEHLRDVLEPYNTSVVLRGPDGDQLTADGPEEPFDVVLTDASGATRSTTFAYPEGPLDTNNLPALLYDVEEELLGDTGMSFVAMTERSDRWRFLLLSDDRLSALRDKYGDDVELFDRSLLHETSLAEFAEPEPQPEDVEEDDDAPGWLSDDGDGGFEDVGFETAEVEDREEETVETKAIDQEGIDELFDSMEETTGRASADAGTGDEPDVADLVGDASAEAGGSTAASGPSAAEDAAGAPESADADAAVEVEPEPEPAVSPGEQPSPAITRLSVTPSADPTPAATRIGIVPGTDPEPAVRRVETEPSITPGADPRPAVTRIDVTPADDPDAAVTAADPADQAEPAEPVDPTEPADPAGGTAETEGAADLTEPEPSPEPSVTPGADPTPAVTAPPTPEAAPETDATAEPTAFDGEPQVTPTTDEPTPAVRLTPEAEAERVVVENDPVAAGGADESAASDSPAEPSDTPAETPGEPRVAPTDVDPTPAVQPATAESTADDRRPGALSRLVGWVRNLF